VSKDQDCDTSIPDEVQIFAFRKIIHSETNSDVDDEAELLRSVKRSENLAKRFQSLFKRLCVPFSSIFIHAYHPSNPANVGVAEFAVCGVAIIVIDGKPLIIDGMSGGGEWQACAPATIENITHAFAQAFLYPREHFEDSPVRTLQIQAAYQQRSRLFWTSSAIPRERLQLLLFAHRQTNKKRLRSN
jgi:hypothetical protein